MDNIVRRKRRNIKMILSIQRTGLIIKRRTNIYVRMGDEYLINMRRTETIDMDLDGILKYTNVLVVMIVPSVIYAQKQKRERTANYIIMRNGKHKKHT